MPHVRMIFFEDDETVRDALRVHRNEIQKLVAETFGYSYKNVKLIPDTISARDRELATNPKQLVFDITAGSRVGTNTHTHVDSLTLWMGALLKLKPIPFLVWLRPQHGTVVSEHKPR